MVSSVDFVAMLLGASKILKPKKYPIYKTIPKTYTNPIPDPNPIHQPKVEMKPSKIPSTRLGRIYEFTSLGIGITGGIISDKLKQSVGLSSGNSIFSPANVERIVQKLIKMRGAALKIGQMLSIQDSKMIPEEVHTIMRRVQNSADFMPEWQLDGVLNKELGSDWMKDYEHFEKIPIAAASIGQVHKAKLKTGETVAVKIQYPGVVESIDSDLDNLVMLLSLGQLLPKGLYLDNTVRVARNELKMECDYLREAASIDRFRELIKMENLDRVFHVPKVYTELSTEKVLVTEFVYGKPIDTVTNLSQMDRDYLGSSLLKLCLMELFEFRFMQTDPNWSNFLYNEKTKKIELLDFGAARDFPKSFTDTYLKLLKAGADQDREKAIQHSIELGFLTGLESQQMTFAHVNSLFTLALPFHKTDSPFYDFGKSSELTEKVRSDIPTMLRERLTPPPDETYSLHRKLSGCFLLCGKLKSRINCAKEFETRYKAYKF
ncbi:putative aarF domain-containing protein kinase 4 [Boothiomyces macroporosus]|uniref:AarF domain-containing protein kinase 4 n=1 Tax=Boothiomyces macroporosus TaxID=261099 RepID=A0AAD5UA77_9FUNG|nr:putative aarF domain-containing protein kinase 4 [Boothiomyces macroporosus]